MKSSTWAIRRSSGSQSDTIYSRPNFKGSMQPHSWSILCIRDRPSSISMRASWMRLTSERRVGLRLVLTPRQSALRDYRRLALLERPATEVSSITQSTWAWTMLNVSGFSCLGYVRIWIKETETGDLRLSLLLIMLLIIEVDGSWISLPSSRCLSYS